MINSLDIPDVLVKDWHRSSFLSLEETLRSVELSFLSDEETRPSDEETRLSEEETRHSDVLSESFLLVAHSVTCSEELV